jgi:hypothetical protein
MTTTAISPYVAVDTPALPVAQRFRLGFSDVMTLTHRELMV